MADELNCDDIIYSEDYLEFILDYRENSATVLPAYYSECIQRINENYVVAYARKEMFDTIIKNIGYRTVPSCYGILDTQVLETTGVLRLRRQPFLNLYGQGVILGIIDCGIDYKNEAFVWENNTSKITSVWVQSDTTGAPPPEFGYGREYSNTDINTALKNQGRNGLPDEIGPNVRDILDNIDKMIDDNGHGTAMAQIAAGREIPEREFSGVAPRADIAVVKLRQAKEFYRDYYKINESADAFLESDIMLGIRYLLNVSIRERKPMVICLGIGTNQGDHNGRGPLAEYLNSLSGLYGLYICTAAGNETGRKHHFRSGVLTKNDYTDVQIYVSDTVSGQGGFTTELWASSASYYSVQIKPPAGDFSGIVNSKSSSRRDFNFQLVGSGVEVFSEIVERSSGDQLVHFRFINPAQGIWTIRVIQDGNVPGIFDMWLPVEGFSASAVNFQSADPDITICEPGNAYGPITMGASTIEGTRIYVNSSRGYTRNGIIKPELVAPGEGIYIITDRGNDYVTGTSYASAVTGGILALFAEWSIPLRPAGTIGAKQYLIRGADTTNLTVPDRSFGYGRINIYSTFVAISE